MEKIKSRLSHCPSCGEKKLSLTEVETEVPYFGRLFLFSMKCEGCGFKKSDVETETRHEPERWEMKVEVKKDLTARVVKSSEARVELGGLGSIEPGPAAEGFITNVEGLIVRFASQLRHLCQTLEGHERQAAEKALKKIDKVLEGEEKILLIIEDPSGASAIISEKAKRAKLKNKI